MKTKGNAPAAMAASAKEKSRYFDRGSRRRGSGRDGLSRTERDVLDLHDAGVTDGEITHALDLRPGHATRIIRMYAESPRERDADAAARAGSEALLAAQLRFGQHSLPSTLAMALMVQLQMAAPASGGRP